MNLRMRLVLAVLSVVALSHAEGQGIFRNLDFENPILPLDPNDPSGVPIANALPGWSGYIQGVPVGGVFYNTISIGAAAISLQGPGSSYQPFQGSYFVILQRNYPSQFIIPSLAQTGTVPGWAASLRFYAIGSLSVTLDNNDIPLVSLGSTASYTIYGGDVSTYAGRSGELRFTGGGSLDYIQFSDQPLPVPEPSALSLVGLGALLVACQQGRSAFAWRSCFGARVEAAQSRACARMRWR